MSRRLQVIDDALKGLSWSICMCAPCSIDKHQLMEFIDLCRQICFPQYAVVMHPAAVLNQMIIILTEQLVSGFSLRDTYHRSRLGDGEPEPTLPLSLCAGSFKPQSREHAFRTAAEYIVEEFVRCRLAKVKVLLQLDVEALYHHDVAAESKCEIVLTYPGVTCMLHQRIAHELFLLGAPNNITRMLTEMAHSITGIDIHPHTSIGHHFFIDHGTGVVIGATAEIGNHVCIYQGVTLGARSFPLDPVTGAPIKSLPRHPIIEDGVIIYSNAVVLGRITIGANAVIAGNAWVTKPVPRDAVVASAGNLVMKNSKATAVLFNNSTNGAGI
jgi:serine O-acetyltransferase